MSMGTNCMLIMMRRCIGPLMLLVTGVAFCQTNKQTKLLPKPTDKQIILRVIEGYSRAGESGDVGLWQSLFWLDDPRFSIIENDRPHIMGPEYINSLGELIRKRGKQPPKQRWHDTKVYMLDADQAYTISLREELNSKKSSRATFVFEKKKGQWRIIHGHFSYVPE